MSGKMSTQERLRPFVLLGWEWYISTERKMDDAGGRPDTEGKAYTWYLYGGRTCLRLA
jgi:hypothetical protein